MSLQEPNVCFFARLACDTGSFQKRLHKELSIFHYAGPVMHPFRFEKDERAMPTHVKQ